MVQVLLNILSLLNIFLIFIVVFFDRKKPESTLAWVLVLFFVPYVGIFLYIVFGEFFRFGIKKKERDKIVIGCKGYLFNLGFGKCFTSWL